MSNSGRFSLSWEVERMPMSTCVTHGSALTHATHRSARLCRPRELTRPSSGCSSRSGQPYQRKRSLRTPPTSHYSGLTAPCAHCGQRGPSLTSVPCRKQERACTVTPLSTASVIATCTSTRNLSETFLLENMVEIAHPPRTAAGPSNGSLADSPATECAGHCGLRGRLALLRTSRRRRRSAPPCRARRDDGTAASTQSRRVPSTSRSYELKHTSNLSHSTPLEIKLWWDCVVEHLLQQQSRTTSPSRACDSAILESTAASSSAALSHSTSSTFVTTSHRG